MRRLARRLVSTLNTRRWLSWLGLAYWSDLDASERRVITANYAKQMAEDCAAHLKCLRAQEREEFREAMNIRGAKMAQFYRVCVENCEPTAEIRHRVFRITLRPLNYCLNYAPLEYETYAIPVVRELFAEQTAHEFSKFIREHLPAEITKQLEAQI
jgi:hypothetical protein